MLRILLGSLAAAVVMFIWGFVSWMVLDWHAQAFEALPDEQAVISSLGKQLKSSGTYLYPYPVNMSDEEATARWNEQRAEGPFILLRYQTGGDAGQMTTSMIIGFVLNFLAALVVSLVVWLARGSARNGFLRWSIVFLFGLFLAIMGDLYLWNWMHQELDVTLINTADQIILFALAGIPIAMIVRPSQAQLLAETGFTTPDGRPI